MRGAQLEVLALECCDCASGGSAEVAGYFYVVVVGRVVVVGDVPVAVGAAVVMFVVVVVVRRIDLNVAAHVGDYALAGDAVRVVRVERVVRVFWVAADARWSAVAYNYGETAINRMRTSVSYCINNGCCSKRIMTASIISAIEIINYGNNFAVVGCCRYWNCKRCIIVVSICTYRVVARTCYCRIFGITARVFDIWCWIYCISTQVGNCIGISYSPRAIVTRLDCYMRYSKVAAIVCVQSLDIIIRCSCRPVGIAKVHVFFASRERTSSNQLRCLIILNDNSVCSLVFAMQSIVVGYMQLYPVGSVTIFRVIAIVIWNYSTNGKPCFILCSHRETIQSETTGPSVCISWSCCFDIGDNFLCTNIRTNVSKVCERYHRQWLNGNCEFSTLSTIVIVSYIDMVSSCFFRTYCYSICIVRSSCSCVYTMVPYIIVVSTDTTRINRKSCSLTFTYYRRICLYMNIGRIFYQNSCAA